MRKKLGLGVLIGVMCYLPSGFAKDVWWSNGGGDRQWRNAANWGGPAQGVPAPDDHIFCNRTKGMHLVVRDGDSAEVNGLTLGLASGEKASFEMTGGKLSIQKSLMLNDPSNKAQNHVWS